MFGHRDGGIVLLNLKSNKELIRGGMPLTPQQIAVVDHVIDKRVTVVSAGAGTGKTHTMVATVLEILENSTDVNIDDFVLITFTNAATDEMRNRLNSSLLKRLEMALSEKDEGKASFWLEQRERLSSSFIGTIHAFCSMILKTFGYEERIPHETEILTARRFFLEAMQRTMNDAINDTSLSVLFREVSWAPYEMKSYMETIYESLRNRGRDIDVVLEETQQKNDHGKNFRVATAQFLKYLDAHYSKMKQNEGGVDSTDLLMITARVMKKYQNHIVPLLSNRFKYLFVDEFQDTDEIQMQIVTHLLPALRGVLVVGDRKQAIYGFRGSDDSVLIKMSKIGKMEKPLVLSVSRRPTLPLLRAQNHLFADMSSRYEVMEELLDPFEEGREPRDTLPPFQYVFVSRGNLQQRMTATVNHLVNNLVGQQRIDIESKKDIRLVKYQDICMLFRSNHQLMAYADHLRNNDIPYIIESGGKFFSKPEIIGFYYMLQAILRYPNDVAINLLLQTPYLPVRPPEYTLRSYEKGVDPLCDWLSSDTRVEKWYNGMMEIRRRSKMDLVPQLLMKILDFTKIREWYTKRKDYQAVANLEKLVMWSREQMNSEALTLQQFTDRLQLAILSGEEMKEADIGIETKKIDAVILSTIHSAKGLEYPIVLIPELQRKFASDYNTPDFFDREGHGLDISLPGFIGKSTEYEEREQEYKRQLLEEEARVLYVAVTRAKNAVVFSSGGLNRPPSSSQHWSWKDEVMPSFRTLPRDLRWGIGG